MSRRTPVRAVIVIIAAIAINLGLLSPLYAATPTLQVSAVAVSTPVDSGDPITFQVSWACSSTTDPCTDASLVVPIPSTSDGDVTTYYSSTGSTGGHAPAPTVTGGQLVWTFNPVLAAGASGQVTFSVVAPNLKTTNGATVEPTATFSASNAQEVSHTATAVVGSDPDLAIDKRRIGTQQNPAVDTDVTYQITAAHGSTISSQTGRMANAPHNGTWAVDNVVVTDHLPAGAVFVSATHGGVYDPATHTVTWPAWSENGAYYAAPSYLLTLRYPSGVFDEQSEITNTATVTANPYRQPAVTVSAEDAVSHGIAVALGSGSIGKTASFAGAVQTGRGATAGWVISIVNSGSVPLNAVATDALPCQFTSPTDGSTTCSTPAITDVQFRLNNGSYGTYTVDYVTNLGSTGSLTLTSAGSASAIQQPISSATEWITSFTVTSTMNAGERANLSVSGTVNPDLPTSAPSGTPYVRPGVPLTAPLYVENCIASGTLTDQAGNLVAQAGPNACGYLVVKPPAPAIQGWKYANDSVQAIGGSVRFHLQFQNGAGDTAWQPVIADLLPANLRFQPGSVTTNMGTTGALPDAQMVIEVIEDYLGTGRQLVRFSWPEADPLAPSTGFKHLHFRAVVQPQAAVGQHTNEVFYFDEHYRNYNNPANPANCGGGSRSKLDELNLSGIDDPALYGCAASAPYTVIATGGLGLIKEVQNSYDAEYAGAGQIGKTQEDHESTYRITARNDGNVEATSLVVYDLLPHVGDYGVGPASSSPRGSEYPVALAGAVSTPQAPDAVIEYSTADNPCRGEVFTAGGSTTSGPPDCIDDWDSTLPSDAGDVTGVRVDFGGRTFAPGAEQPIIIPVTVPADASGIAWNSAALAGQRADNDTWLLPVEPPVVGLAITHPAIEIVKSINGDDANDAPGVAVEAGSQMVITYDVTNTGALPLSEVTVTDDVVDASAISCPSASLAVGESMTCTAALTAPVDGNQLHANIGTVTGVGPIPNDGSPTQTVTDEDPANAHTIAEPSVGIVKLINGDDANESPGVAVVAGSSMAITFEVTNTGNVPLYDVAVTDDVLDDAAISCPADTLAVGESMTCSASLLAPAEGNQLHTNIGTVTALGPELVDGTPAQSVSADDPANAYTIAAADIAIIKMINGDDADEAPGVSVAVGSTMMITFEVTNTGNVPLYDVTVTDDVVDAAAISCPTDTLAVDESMTCTAQLAAPEADVQHHNTGTVVGTPLDVHGEPGEPVTDSDDAYAIGTIIDTPEPPAPTPPGPETPGPDTPVAPDEPKRTPLASTDVDAAGMLGWGLGLLVIGALVLFGGARRRN